MARGQVSQRRRHTENDIDDEDTEVYASTPKNKRQRVQQDEDPEDEEDEDGLEEDHENRLEHGSQSPEGSLLPDSFRRSPRGACVPSQHQPGSIIRVRLKNFVTYSAAEFHPGPNLNMVIGLNGTGKSTLVCAICLGLGWERKHLGGQSKEGDFVKNGTLRAEIEIELAADWARHAENPAITTIIT
ncbi:Structural maintenance of chromosomes protein 5 [Recurvomyces mirabilis]|nr:Structural maintenance of chromosomes protein 5 [Recurvomyces mirabilis]